MYNNNNNTLFVLINVNIDTMNRRYQRLSLSRVSPFKLKQFKSTQLNSTQIESNQMLVFEERGKPEYPEKNLSEQSREPTNSAHLRRRVRESNPGHIGGKRVLYHCANPAPPGVIEALTWRLCSGRVFVQMQ